MYSLLVFCSAVSHSFVFVKAFYLTKKLLLLQQKGPNNATNFLHYVMSLQIDFLFNTFKI